MDKLEFAHRGFVYSAFTGLLAHDEHSVADQAGWMLPMRREKYP